MNKKKSIYTDAIENFVYFVYSSLSLQDNELSMLNLLENTSENCRISY